MSVVKTVLMVLGASAGVSFLVGRFLESTTICGHCEDTGQLWVNENPPRMQFCNFCMLGQQYEKSAARKAVS